MVHKQLSDFDKDQIVASTDGEQSLHSIAKKFS